MLEEGKSGSHLVVAVEGDAIFSKNRPKGSMCKEKRIGPIIDTWGTPQEREAEVDRQISVLALNGLSLQ